MPQRLGLLLVFRCSKGGPCSCSCWCEGKEAKQQHIYIRKHHRHLLRFDVFPNSISNLQPARS